MSANPLLGVSLHAAGGFAAGSFYIPYKKVKKWAWETYWLVGGFFAWIVSPWAVAALACPGLLGVLKSAPPKTVLWTYLFGVLWGMGGLTFGLSMRYLGMSLGYAITLGFCAVFGTLVPPVFEGRIGAVVGTASGRVTILGILVCLAGIAVCGRAGIRKEKEVGARGASPAMAEFDFKKGLWVAVFSGIMSSCMAFSFAAGKPLAEQAVAAGTPAIFQNSPVMIIGLFGGFTTNAIWCLILRRRNKTGRDWLDRSTPLLPNYLFSALAGIIWYFQFFFYGMGTTRMGRYDFSSWSIHMAFIIIFSNLWGLVLREWKGSGPRTRRLMIAGLAVLIASTAVIGFGNYLAAR